MSERAYVGGCFCGAIELRIEGRPCRDGLLSLHLLPAMVGQPGECLHPLATDRGDHRPGRQAGRHLRPERARRPKVVHPLRRAPVHRAPRGGDW